MSDPIDEEYVRRLERALASCRAALTYAFEDTDDHYYTNVLIEINSLLSEKKDVKHENE